MSKVYVFITNGPAGSGKDAISAAVQNSLQNNITNKIQDQNLIISFKKALFQYTSNFFNINVDDFYQDKEGGFYDRTNKELPNVNLTLDENNIEKIKEFYINTNKSLGINKEYSDVINNINKTIDEFKLKYKITEANLSPRNALIFTSECLIKPMYGGDFFGDVVAKEISNIYEENKLLNGNVNIYITDSGFVDELKAISNLASKKDVHPVILSIYRKGYDYDSSKDSRVRLEESVLKNAGINNMPLIRIDNNQSLAEVVNKTILKIKDFKNGIITPDKNKVILTFYDHVEQANLSKIKHIMEIFNKDKNNLEHNFIINNVSIIDKNISIEVVNENGIEFSKKDIAFLNRVADLWNPYSQNVFIKRNASYEFDENILVNNEFNFSSSLKNLKENLNGIEDSGIFTLKKVEDSIIEFLEFKPKNDQIFKIFNASLLQRTNELLEDMKHNFELKTYESNIKSLNTLCKNNLEKLEHIKMTGIESKNDIKVVKVNSFDIKDTYDVINKLREKSKFDYEILSKDKKIDLVKTNEGFEIIIKGLPYSKLKFLEQESVKIENHINPNNIKPAFDSKKVLNLSQIKKELEFELSTKDIQQQFNGLKVLQVMESFIKEPNAINYINSKKILNDYNNEIEDESINNIIHTALNNLSELNPKFQIVLKINEDKKEIQNKKEQIGIE